MIIFLLTGAVLAVWVIEFFKKHDQDGEATKSAVDHIAGSIERFFDK